MINFCDDFEIIFGRFGAGSVGGGGPVARRFVPRVLSPLALDGDFFVGDGGMRSGGSRDFHYVFACVRYRWELNGMWTYHARKG